MRAAVSRLDLADSELDVVLGGGLLQSGNRQLLAGIEAGLREVGPHLSARPAASRPIVGAALAALDRFEAGPDAYERARAGLDRATASLGDMAGDAAPVAELP